MITEQDLKRLYLEAKDSEVRAEEQQLKYKAEPEKEQFFRGKKEAYAYMATRIENLMKWKEIVL